MRVTQLDCNGNVAGTADNSYVTDNAISISLTPNIETGNTFSARNGCGCNVARFKANDTFNWFEFSFANAALEPIMQSMMLGAATIVDGGDTVGLAFPSTLECDECEPSVALEFWTKHIIASGQDLTYPWVHWVFPKTVWSLADNTFEEDFAQPTLNGFSRTNPNWGDGPYGDGPPDSEDISEGGWWKTAVEPPAATCDSGDVSPSS